mmetsp:Transcript_5529/g.13367  ORF Transcript_5529/g.13367 Transcript_5529/m.13367 type:complete len:337 (+) Transcript_5529:1337-2347(+)
MVIVDFADDRRGQLALVLAVPVNARTVLGADVGALAVQRGRVVDREEDFEQFAQRHLCGIEIDPHNLGMAGVAAADLLIVGVRMVAVAVAVLDLVHAAHALVDGLQAPEAAAGKGDAFEGCRRHDGLSVGGQGEFDMGTPRLTASGITEFGRGQEDARVRRATGQQRVAHGDGAGHGELAQRLGIDRIAGQQQRAHLLGRQFLDHAEQVLGLVGQRAGLVEASERLRRRGRVLGLQRRGQAALAQRHGLGSRVGPAGQGQPHTRLVGQPLGHLIELRRVGQLGAASRECDLGLLGRVAAAEQRERRRQGLADQVQDQLPDDATDAEFRVVQRATDG